MGAREGLVAGPGHLCQHGARRRGILCRKARGFREKAAGAERWPGGTVTPFAAKTRTMLSNLEGKRAGHWDWSL